MTSYNGVSTESLSSPSWWSNISAGHLEKQQAEVKQNLDLLEIREDSTVNNVEVGTDSQSRTQNAISQLLGLEKATDDLILAKDIVSWSKNLEKVQEGDLSPHSEVFGLAEICERLGQLLRRHKRSTTPNSLHNHLYQNEFAPAFQYLKKMLSFQLRISLQKAGFPSKESCASLMREYEEGQENCDFHMIATAAKWLYRLQAENDFVVSHVLGTSVTKSESVDAVVVELCRPFVERIQYHFVQQKVNDRIERLPEWLFAYIRENVYSSNQDNEEGPWEFIHFCFTPAVNSGISLDFANEMIRLIQWVFAQREIFRHPKLSGPDSQPSLLCTVIDQLLHFDDFIMKQTGNASGRVMSLMDIYVAGDDDLLHWWLDREHEAVFDSLLDGKLENDLPFRISPRAEIFCSLLQSIKRKATVFSFSGPYLKHVAAPLCMHFLEAVHGSSVTLKDSLLSKRKLPTALELKQNVEDWLKLVNGTHMSALMLIGNDGGKNVSDGSRSTSDEEMKRFGRSLERLEHVLVDEFATSFVENILIERAKLANYFMRCSHMLASDTDNSESGFSELSPDLADAQFVLNIFLASVAEPPTAKSSPSRDFVYHSSRALRDRVLTLLSEKFLEVALDCHGTTPGITLAGSLCFAVDVGLLFGESLLPTAGMRLLDVTKCMSMPPPELSGIGNALCGLAGQSPPLTEDSFTMDERVYEEAMSMITAKNFLFLQLGDLLSILNRREDLSCV